VVARDGVEPPTPAFSEINSDYNDFVARVALEVVDSAWWKQRLRVKSAGSRKTLLSPNERASGQSLFGSTSFGKCGFNETESMNRQDDVEPY
jgi:hypothetical protein